MSWESTASYYKLINEGVRAELGGLHSAKICMHSVDFAQIEKFQQQGDWAAMAEILVSASQGIEAAGGDFLLICTNTMHKVAHEIEKSIDIPLLHIADATAKRLVTDNIKRVGLIGTRFTMEEEFYKGRLADLFAIDVIVPDTAQQNRIHDVIFKELCLGKIVQQSRVAYLEIIDALFARGAEAVILGCTEIALLVQQEHTAVPLYDTTEIHALSAVQLALEK